MKDIFLPPGVQRHLAKEWGRIPRTAPDRVAAQIEALWQRRNNAPECELSAIDGEMERLALAGNRSRYTKSAATRALQFRLVGLRSEMQKAAGTELRAWQRGRRGAYLAALQITREVAQ